MSEFSTDKYRIQDLADMAEVSRRTVRYYVQRGLIDPPLGKGRGSHYTSTHLTQLLNLKKAQEQGASLEEIEAQLSAPAALKFDLDQSAFLSFTSRQRSQFQSMSVQDSHQRDSHQRDSYQHDSHQHDMRQSVRDEQSLSSSAVISDWQRVVISQQIEVHVKAGTLSAEALDQFHAHLLKFFQSDQPK
jgi:DNA-binding transcriptional MerR regulator